MKTGKIFLGLFLFITLLVQVIVAQDAGCFSEESTRPGLPYAIRGENFVVHYGGDLSDPYLPDSILAYAEYSYNRQCVEFHWKKPPADFNHGGDNLYDIYIIDSDPAYPYPTTVVDTFATTEDTLDIWQSEWAPSFIVIPPKNYTYNELKSIVAHEFNHACQMAYSYKDVYFSAPPFWFAENTAELMSEETWNYQYKYYERFFMDSNDPLHNPEEPINCGAGSDYKYAGFLWPKFLMEWSNDRDIVRKIWERFSDTQGAHTLEDIDTVIHSVKSSTLADASCDYAVWRYYTGARADTSYFEMASEYPTLRVTDSIYTFPHNNNYVVRHYRDTNIGGSTILVLTGNTPKYVSMSFNTDANVEMRLVIMEKNGDYVRTRKYSVQGGHTLSAYLDIQGTDVVTIIATAVSVYANDFHTYFDFEVVNENNLVNTSFEMYDENSNLLSGEFLLEQYSLINSGDEKSLFRNTSYNIKTLDERIGRKKHLCWNSDYNDHFLDHVFTTPSAGSYNRTANFKTLNYSLIQINSEEASVNFRGYFNDPWYAFSDNTQPGSDYWISFDSYYEPTGKEGASEKGVFLMQGYSDPNKPYYSVKVESPQTININNRDHKFYFQWWEASPSGSASFQHADQAETPVVFNDAGATVTAVMKGTQLSDDQSAFANNNQRKMIRTANGNLFLTYESMNQVWLEMSTDNGRTWDFVNYYVMGIGSPSLVLDGKGSYTRIRG